MKKHNFNHVLMGIISFFVFLLMLVGNLTIFVIFTLSLAFEPSLTKFVAMILTILSLNMIFWIVWFYDRYNKIFSKGGLI